MQGKNKLPDNENIEEDKFIDLMGKVTNKPIIF